MAGRIVSRMDLGRRALALFALVMLLDTASGCTLVGLGIGAAVPRYEPGSPAEGDRIRVGEVEGRYEGVRGDDLVVTTDGGPRRIAKREAGAVEVAKGSSWKTGLVVGGFIDAVLLTTLIATAATADYGPNLSGAGGMVPIMR